VNVSGNTFPVPHAWADRPQIAADRPEPAASWAGSTPASLPDQRRDLPAPSPIDAGEDHAGRALSCSTAKLRNIQALRALAAWGVVGHHLVDSLNNYLVRGRFEYMPRFGSFGVEVFFVVSGYVMMLTAARRELSPGRFLVERLLRIAPPYWLLTLVAFATMTLGFHAFSLQHAGVDRLLASLLFLPWFEGGRTAMPIVFPGWTLNYEMMFYALFALFLPVRSEAMRIAGICGVLGAAVLTQWLTNGPLAGYLGREIVVGFGLGVLLWPIARGRRVAPAASWALVSSGLMILLAADATGLRAGSHVELLVSGGALMIVAGAILLEQAGCAVRREWIVAQGDASYALYLVHPFVIALLGKAALVLRLNVTMPGIVLTLAAMIAISALAAAGLHRWFERPVYALARRLS
jgi:exopolysaccharide production protein ExoZ